MPLSTKEISKTKTPWFFYLEDPLNIGVFDQPHLEETYADGKGLRRRAKTKADAPDTPVDQTANARLQKITGEQHFFVDYCYDGDLIATAEVQPQYETTPGNFVFQPVDGTIDIDNEAGVMTCVGSQGGFSWDAEIGFSDLTKKWSWTITAPGFTGRLVWIIDLTALGQQMVADGDLKIDYSDYVNQANISDDQGVAQRTIIFEPDGMDLSSGWTVDPYLSVNDESAYYQINIDGFYIRINKTNQWYVGQVFDLSDTAIAQINYNVRDTSTYQLCQDTDRVVRVTSNELFAHVYIKGDLYSGVDTGLLSNLDYAEVNLYIYPSGMIYEDWRIFATGGDITIDDSMSSNKSGMWFTIANITNEDNISANSGGTAEEDPGDYFTPTGRNYYGIVSDEVNFIISEVDVDASYYARFDGAGNIYHGFNNTTISSGTSKRNIVAWFIDSADRENDGGTFNTWSTGVEYTAGHILLDSGLRYYAPATYTSGANIAADISAGDLEEYRMTLATAAQAIDGDMAVPTDGSEETDWVIPLTLTPSGTDAFTSAGDRRITADSAEKTTVPIDTDRIGFALKETHGVYAVGDTVTSGNRLVGHWKMDDSQGDSYTIVDATGNNNGTLEGGDYPSAKDQTDAVRGTSLLLNGTDDCIAIDGAWTELTSKEKWTVAGWVKPNFAEATAQSHTIFSVYQDWNVFVRFYYDNSADEIRLSYRFGGGSLTHITDWADFDTLGDAFLQQWREFVVSIDTTAGILYMKYGEFENVVAVSDSLNDVTYQFDLGKDAAGTLDNGAYYFDEVKLIDGCYLPYGGGPHVTNDTDYSLAHTDVLFHWSGSDCTASNVEIGSIQGTKGGSGGSFPTTGGVFGDDYFDSAGTANLQFSVTPTQFEPNTGIFAAWINIQAISAGDAIFGIGDADDNIQAVMDASGNIDVTYESQTVLETITGDIALGTGEWHYLWVGYDDTEKLSCKIDGVENGTAQDIANTWDGVTSGTLYLAADYAGSNIADIYIQHVHLTNKKYTPIQGCILGQGPLQLRRSDF